MKISGEVVKRNPPSFGCAGYDCSLRRVVGFIVRRTLPVTFSHPEDLVREYASLEKFGKDMTAMARKGKFDPVIGRDREIHRCIQILSMKNKNNPMLIGEPGVGKTAIAEGIAQRIVKGDVPRDLINRKLISLDMGALIAGTEYHGKFEKRFKKVLKEVVESDGQIILFFDEIHTIVGAGGGYGATNNCAMDAGNLLKPMLGRGELRCIGATTWDEYHKYIEMDRALERRFQQVKVEQPTVEETVVIPRGLCDGLELFHGVRISDSALVGAAILSDRYISERFLPDKAIDLVDEAAAKLKMGTFGEIIHSAIDLSGERESLLINDTDKSSKDRFNAELELLREEVSTIDYILLLSYLFSLYVSRLTALYVQIHQVHMEIEQAKREDDHNRLAKLENGNLNLLRQLDTAKKALLECSMRSAKLMIWKEVTGNDIAEIVSERTGIPLTKLKQSDREKILSIDDELHKRLVGQDSAVTAVANAIHRSRADLSDPHRPIASLMFMGPTGVGKTELAKALAYCLFNTEEALVRIDMSEYMEKHNVSRLIGTPPGYVGYEEGGQLTETICKRPYDVILFDEIEKAHADVFNLFLQILDNGMLTDSHGRKVRFTNTVIIMTSNVGSQDILDTKDSSAPKEQAYKTIKQKVMDAARSIFRPEFMNRVDEYIVFQPLDRSQINSIVRLQLEHVQDRIVDRKIKINVSEAAVEVLGSLEYDPNYGARPVKRVIQQHVGNELAKGIIRGDFEDEDTILVDTEVTVFSNGQLPQPKLVFKKVDSLFGDASEGQQVLSQTL
ncbi:chaperone protein ClpB3, chloroplastic-like [Rutidosis leptorrhynchoides]|uniref:chaperone protein ClpB3, chloroplastic-like n=1 Tax=Rutidosis leptorrhynchoides TaxID=125765 RepID=UPI003A992D57